MNITEDRVSESACCYVHLYDSLHPSATTLWRLFSLETDMNTLSFRRGWDDLVEGTLSPSDCSVYFKCERDAEGYRETENVFRLLALAS